MLVDQRVMRDTAKRVYVLDGVEGIWFPKSIDWLGWLWEAKDEGFWRNRAVSACGTWRPSFVLKLGMLCGVSWSLGTLALWFEKDCSRIWACERKISSSLSSLCSSSRPYPALKPGFFRSLYSQMAPLRPHHPHDGCPRSHFTYDD